MKKVGILGGGQLALMMLPALKKLGHEVYILDQEASPCHDQDVHFLPGNFSSPKDCLKLKDCDVVTFEIENISLEGLEKLSKLTSVSPSPAILRLIQNKGEQKKFLKQISVPTSDFEIRALKKDEDLLNKVVKLTTGGYDGKGVFISKGDLPPASFLNTECLIEERVSIKKELGVVCSRSKNGEIALYEPVEMVMDQELNLLSYQQNPADISSGQKEEVLAIVKKIAAELDYVGTLAVEFFIDIDDKIWVNELAPRVHNSGHNTIESAPCSQFENHIRAITDMPLGQATPALPSVTANLIGSGKVGATQIEMPEELGDDVHIHLYNKKQSRPGRKMGHITFVGEDLIEKKDSLLKMIKITGKEE